MGKKVNKRLLHIAFKRQNKNLRRGVQYGHRKRNQEHLDLALSEIGEIKPWYDRSFKNWIFSHSAYPVEYAGNSEEKVLINYPLYLRHFIKERLKDNLSRLTEKETKGKGGKREGAGRKTCWF